MTTVAYSAGMLAADRLITRGDVRFGFTRKIAQGPLGHMGGAGGGIADMTSFLDWIASGCVGAPPVAENDAAGMVIFPDRRVFHWSGAARITEYDTDFAAEGNGAPFALAAMHMGATPKEAVEIAIKLDTHSGGDVDVLYLPGVIPPQLRPARRRK